MTSHLGGHVEIVVGDITALAVDVVVNAANAALCGGGGVDGAIHRAAGPELLAECRTLGGARPGEVRLTAGYDLPAKHIAHAVGPVWRGGDQGEEAQLAGCYSTSIELARSVGAHSIAFPAISTGAYHYPMNKATEVALCTVAARLSELSTPMRVVFCCFSDKDAAVYRKLARRLLTE